MFPSNLHEPGASQPLLGGDASNQEGVEVEGVAYPSLLSGESTLNFVHSMSPLHWGQRSQKHCSSAKLYKAHNHQSQRPAAGHWWTDLKADSGISPSWARMDPNRRRTRTVTASLLLNLCKELKSPKTKTTKHEPTKWRELSEGVTRGRSLLCVWGPNKR